MDDSCAVCAETLQWAAYGPCGHREVCSTCVVRMRFVCEDRRCCLCKRESGVIFITKALGDFTRMINDFTIFPGDPKEGQVGAYWYHEGTQAFFDDVDHYKMIKAMCRLSCSACGDGSKWNFTNVELLKNHLAQRHRLSMCSLCLEGRKAFICEQKLYTEAQLYRHIKTGDSVVDGSETERGGFMGHPICQFCEKPFYGDNELFSHMSTEHYTCFICQRQHPGQHNYLRNYDDLETHFRQAHFLCEDEVCLEKKFVVFTSESEMKRHNALEHGGRMSRSKRSAALQIPVSFQFRQVSHQDRRGRGRRFHSDSAENQLSRATQETPGTSDPPSLYDTSSSARPVSNGRETNAFQSVGSFDLLTSLESEPSSIQHSQASSRPNSSCVPLEQASFPPLPVSQGKGKKKNKNVVGVSSRLHPQSNGSLSICNTSLAWSTAHGPPNTLASFPRLSSVSNSGNLPLSSSHFLPQSRPGAMNMHSSSSSFLTRVSVGKTKTHEPSSSSSSTAASSSRKLHTNGTVTQSSASAPNHLNRGTFDDPVSNFPPVLAARVTSGQTSAKGEDINAAANKSLVERIRLALLFDENRYAAFKEISSQFRHGIVNTEEYLASVCQFGLSHLVLELARLCPDPDKQRELVEIYKFNTGSSDLPENDPNKESGRSKSKRSSKKGKEKCEENGISALRDASADSVVTSMKNLESSYSVSDQSAKGKAKILTNDDSRNVNSLLELFLERHNDQNGTQMAHNSSKKSSVPAGGDQKQQKKTSKFLRNRLGNDAVSSFSEAGGSEPNERKIEEDKDPPEGLPVSGVWRNRGGQKLVAMTQSDRKKR